MVKYLEVEVFGVKALVNFHVMPVGLGAFPIILGRPWLRGVGAIQDWRRGVITLYNKKGNRRRFYTESTKPLLDEDNSEDIDFDSDTSSSDSRSKEESKSSSSTGDEVAYLTVDKMNLNEAKISRVEEEEDMLDPYEKIEELMQPKKESNAKHKILEKMMCSDLVKTKRSEYLTMLSQFPDLFVTSYE